MKNSVRVLFQAVVIIVIVGIIGFLWIGPLSKAQIRDKKINEKDSILLEKNGRLEPPISDGIYTIEASELGIVSDSDVKNISPARSLEVAADLGIESEPNGTSATANPLSGNGRIKGNIQPNGDVDLFSFSATAGDKVYSAVMTSFSSNASSDSQLRLIGTDGVTEIEFDDDDGTFGGFSSTIAGATLPSSGIYFLRVNHTSPTNQLRPYELYFQLQSGTPTAEIEPNDSPATANPLPMSGWVSGARNPADATEVDWYSMNLNTGDTVYFSLDLDPERDNVQWNGGLGIALFGDAGNQILVADDSSVGSSTNPLSEATFMTVKTAGTYYAFVDSFTASTGGPTATYTLSVSVVPAVNRGVNCTTYTSTDVPKVIPAAGGLVSSTITVPGNPRIADVDLIVNLDHLTMRDVDAHLRSPAGNDNGIFTDIGASATGGQTMMDTIFNDEAGIPPIFSVLKGAILKPELTYRLDWFDGEDAGGVWSLDLRDDTNNPEGGNLTGWALRICEQPSSPTGIQTIYSENFESNNGGFTHSGVTDEWEYGLPNVVADPGVNPVASFQDCASGINCWKTDLDNTYDINSNQNLESPPIFIPPGSTGVNLSWAMRYQMENATFDHAWVEVLESGNPANIRRVWEWTGPTMTDAVGTPVENIGASAGWGTYSADISSFAGTSVIVRFHLDSDTSVNFGGLAIDDLRITRLVTAAPSLVVVKAQDQNGRGVGNVRVILTEQNGTPHYAITNSFGFAPFEGILSQQNVTISGTSKRYTFSDVMIPITGDTFVMWNGTPNF
ncbi:MAG: proprotein convertase P-domain-containing protein [Pyrinomonadaceae bacterium]